MDEIVARKVVVDGEEIIELDLNKGSRKRQHKYNTYMDDVERLTKKKNMTSKEFITILN